MNYDIRLEQREAVPIAAVKLRAKQHELAKVVPEACGVVWQVLKARQVSGGRHVAVYWDDQINLEVGAEVLAPFPGSGDVLGSATPSGLVATTTHQGPYQLLAAAHQAVIAWCRQKGHTLAGPSWEVYGHWKNEWNQDPSKIVTEVFYLLKDDAV